jgi:hypothetical protein
VTRPRAADDFATILPAMAELRQEREAPQACGGTCGTHRARVGAALAPHTIRSLSAAFVGLARPASGRPASSEFRSACLGVWALARTAGRCGRKKLPTILPRENYALIRVERS